MPSQLPDSLHDRLAGLGSDLDDVRLARAHDVRRRGDRRTRHQAVGTAVASVAALGLVGSLALSVLGDDRDARNDVANQPTATPSDVASPAPALLDLAAEPLLTSEQLGRFGTVYGVMERMPGEPDASVLCTSDPARLGAAEVASALFANTELGEGTVSQWVLRFGDAAAAEAAVERIEQEAVACTAEVDPVDVTVDARGPDTSDVGDDAFTYGVLSTPTVDAGTAFTELAAAREDNVVTVLHWHAMGDPYQGTRVVFDDERLSTALETAVG